MATEIQKQSSETLQTERRLFRESAEQELAGMLYMMGQQYRMEITPEISALWTLTLIERGHLSGPQIREGFVAWFAGEKSSFPPQPGEVIAMLSDKAASNVERAPDPACPRCSGTGWRPAIDNSTRMAKCHCWAERPKIESRPQLAPAEGDRLTLADVLKQAPQNAATKPMPSAKPTFADIDPGKNAAKLEQQRRELLK